MTGLGRGGIRPTQKVHVSTCFSCGLGKRGPWSGYSGRPREQNCAYTVRARSPGPNALNLSIHPDLIAPVPPCVRWKNPSAPGSVDAGTQLAFLVCLGLAERQSGVATAAHRAFYSLFWHIVATERYSSGGDALAVENRGKDLPSRKLRKRF